MKDVRISIRKIAYQLGHLHINHGVGEVIDLLPGIKGLVT